MYDSSACTNGCHTEVRGFSGQRLGIIKNFPDIGADNLGVYAGFSRTFLVIFFT